MRRDFVRRVVSVTLSRIGYNVGCYPQLYVAISFILSIVFATGVLNISPSKDIEYLYVPSDARIKTDRAAIESIFSTNKSECDYRRLSRFEGTVAIQVTSKYENSMLEETILEEVIKLDKIIRNVSFLWNNAFVRYEDICCKPDGITCHENYVLSFKGKADDMKKGIHNVKYPVDKIRGNVVVSGFELGGVTINKENMVRDFKAIRLYYPLESATEEKKDMALKWEESLLETLTKVNLNNIEVYKFLSQSVNNEINRIGESIFSIMVISAPIMLIFAAVSCLSTDVLCSKPWLGIAGCVSPFISTVAAFGLLTYCKVNYFALNAIILFLMLGIGVDDSFILLAAWRRTDVKASVPDRMKEAYAEAAVSITITSLTNFFAFCMGFMTPYNCIHIFSAYSALAIIFDYIYQLLFFGGLMALDGYREKHKLHSIFCWPVKQNYPNNENGVYLKSTNKKKKDNIFMAFFGNVLGGILGKPIIKIIVILAFFVYLAGAIYCMRFIQEGSDVVKFFPYFSYVFEYISIEDKFFHNYTHQVQVVVNQTLDYSNVTVQNDIEEFLQSFESAPFTSDSSTTESWLREFLAFTKSPVAEFSLSGYNLSDSEDFLNAFRNVFLKMKIATRFRNDVVFNKEGDKITASRFLISSYDDKTGDDKKTFFRNVRKIGENSKFSTIIFNFRFMYYELYSNILSNCLKAICSAGGTVIIVFIIFTPNILFLLSITITVVSIQVGLIGYMSLWNVSIETTALITLVMCTGFCVDYTVHMSYIFINCKNKTPNEKIKSSLYASGYPVLQGCISTILGVSIAYFGPSEPFLIFSKILMLMAIFALFHSLILLPVVLSILDSISFSFLKKKRHKLECNDNHTNELDFLKSQNINLQGHEV
ncbi:patched domain-containing protein 3-like [Centruroides sculpturatus]|uniref:patched domain-containing protein 3-like n=1 Tax=Centruroides sculpturatus TaxID=218467 RepID=UPI000C6DFA3F|nr:patched domain-containing protein 3-like [Centruroides sculpturatus]XP_023225989.1 patched domain-containing protein 3-like [Centruroides sculpturatus]XP_023225990.1 patched domain-containing protein 3-like [Centruroides sculpturatus]XP_023225991.1 patched domain-containing protein 3-like [Centruroides sculpturatus]XP_023225992.1 patched domain-containing protein 3-like [Centruroides sculpturatus]XP_023225993.1 patched domain-containing protein 3-like [Centruroides sculpturatus]